MLKHIRDAKIALNAEHDAGHVTPQQYLDALEALNTALAIASNISHKKARAFLASVAAE
jgi:hypothetical protein